MCVTYSADVTNHGVDGCRFAVERGLAAKGGVFCKQSFFAVLESLGEIGVSWEHERVAATCT